MPRPLPAIELERLSLHVRADVLDQARRAANHAELTLSRWITEAVREKLAKPVDDTAYLG